MKILRVITTVNPEYGGPIEALKQMSAALKQLGHDTAVVSFDHPNDEWVKSFPFQVYALGPWKSEYRYCADFIPWLKSHSHDFDCVIVHALWQHNTYGTWFALRNSGIPYFVYTHGSLDPWFKKHYPLKHIRKSIQWSLSEHRVLQTANAVFFTSEEELHLGLSTFNPNKYVPVVVPYGTARPNLNLDDALAKFIATFPKAANKRIILYLGRLHEKKGCDILIRAFGEIADRDPRLHLVMAGPDRTNYRPELERIAAENAITDRITWTGMIQGELKWGAYQACEVFILPSHSENFGVSVAEAMSVGRPIMVSDKVMIWREIVHGQAGIVAPDNLEGVSSLLKSWLEIDPQARLEMGRNASRTFMECFEITRVANRFVEILREHGVHDALRHTEVA